MSTTIPPDKSAPLTFDEFTIPTYEAWRKEAEATLAGAPFEKKLVTTTPEGIALQPIYRREDLENVKHLGSTPGEKPFVRGARPDNHWEVAQEIPQGFPALYNQALRSDLERGQTAVNITLDRATRLGADPDSTKPGEAGLCGVSIVSSEDFDRILDGVSGEIPLFLQAGSASTPLFALLVAHLRRNAGKTGALRGALEHDPLAELVSDGTLPHSLDAAFNQMALNAKWAARNAPGFSVIAVQSHVWHDAGANAVQELAFALATAVEYLRRMESRGLGVNETAAQMRFGFSIGTDFFMGIAKLRAARLLWSRVISACGGDANAQKMRIHARTSLWNRTKLDPYVNMLRGTTEAFAAIAGGCDSLHVGAFDEVIRPPDEFSRRIARNTQIILRDECHFDHVIDPAGGSYYVENLTGELGTKAWALFRKIEALGGMAKAIDAGIPQHQVNEVATKKIEAVAQRRDSIIGANVYANATEKPLAPCDLEAGAKQGSRAAHAANHRLAPGQAAQKAVMARLEQIVAGSPEHTFDAVVDAALEGATLGELSRTLRSADGASPSVTRLPIRRASEAFEKLRFAVEAAGRPKVFLANMGPLRQHKARADFSTSFFQAGGFAVEENRGFQTVQLAVEAAQKSKARIIVICSTDETYPELVPPIASLIKASQPNTIIVVAGYPKEHLEAFKAGGVDQFIHIRANCYEVLGGIAAKLGINL